MYSICRADSAEMIDFIIKKKQSQNSNELQIDCRLTPNEEICSYTMARTSSSHVMITMSAGRHGASNEHILIPNQVFFLRNGVCLDEKQLIPIVCPYG